MRITALGAVLVAACDPASNAVLAELPGLHVKVGTYARTDHTDDARGTTFAEVILRYDHDAFRADKGVPCAVVDDMHARIGTLELDLHVEGGGEYEGNGCRDISLDSVIDLPTSGAMDLVVEDDSLTVTATFADGALRGREATSPTHPDWNLRGGDTVVIAIPSADDLAVYARDGIDAGFHREDDGAGFEITAPAVDVAAGTVTLTLPSPAPESGRGSIYFLPLGFPSGSTERDAETCTNATRCTVDASVGYDRAATIQ